MRFRRHTLGLCIASFLALSIQPAFAGRGEFNIRPRLLPSAKTMLICAGVLAVGGVTCGVGTCLYKQDTAMKPEGRFVVKSDLGPALPDLPNEFHVRERIFSIGDKFVVEDGENNYGIVDQELLHLAKTFTYQREDGTVMAKAHTTLFSWGTQIVVENEHGAKIGLIKEDVWKSLLHPMSRYEIYDAQGKLVAISEKSEWLTTDFDLYEPGTGNRIANIHRGAFNWFKDEWAVSFLRPDKIDPRVFVMIPAYKTSVDNDRKSESSSSNDDK